MISPTCNKSGFFSCCLHFNKLFHDSCLEYIIFEICLGLNLFSLVLIVSGAIILNCDHFSFKKLQLYSQVNLAASTLVLLHSSFYRAITVTFYSISTKFFIMPYKFGFCILSGFICLYFLPDRYCLVIMANGKNAK